MPSHISNLQKTEEMQLFQNIEILKKKRDWFRIIELSSKLQNRFPNSTFALVQNWSASITLGELDSAVRLLQEFARNFALTESLYSRYLFSLEAASFASKKDIHQAYRQFADTFFPDNQPRSNLPKSKLNKIGLLSGEMKNHAAANFLLPLIDSLTSSGKEVIAYSTSPIDDSRTMKFKSLCTEWTSFHKITSKQAIDKIEGNPPDVILNCDWHLAHNRLDIARELKNIPQIDYLQAGATGIRQIPYHLTDKYLIPKNEANDNSDRTCLYLEGGAHLYTPHSSASDEPALNRDWQGNLLIGCCNHLSKINDPVIRCWAEILKQCPKVRFLLKSINLDLPEIQSHILERFQNQGISQERLLLLGFAPDDQLNHRIYNRISLALDPFPYNGVTTTCEALWMGTPVITLTGDRPISRKGTSLLHQIGAQDLIAQNQDDYIEKAVSLIQDPNRLRHYHRSLRKQMGQSPLCNSARMSEDFENAFQPKKSISI